MAEAAVVSAVGKLAEVITGALLNKAHGLQGVSAQIKQMQKELGLIQALLRDADSKRNRNELVTEWLNQVREIANTIATVIENFRVQIEENSPESSNCTCFRKITKAVKRNYKTHKLGLPKELEDITGELNRILQRGIQLGIQDKLGAVDDVDDLEPSDMFDDPQVVGFEEDKGNIIKQLLDSSNSRRMVLSIVGTGGLGKTTLAKKVYKSAELERQFDCRAWLSISQQYNLNDLWREILYSIEPEMKKTNPPITDRDLPMKLKSSLRCKRYLIILDDVWDFDLWEELKKALPDPNNASRVIITTRSLDVAKAADCNTKPYELRYLSDAEGLALLFRTAFQQHVQPENYPDHDLLEVAKRLTNKCGGLPLALVVVGGILTRRDRNYTDWNKLYKTMDWHDKDGEKCTKILARSYEDLPDHLQSCFLYFAALPEDYEILASNVIRMWIAEEFIPKDGGGTIEDRAEKCLEELVQRSLVQVSKRSHASSITSCRIHDLLREVVIQKAKEDNFLTICSNPPDNWTTVAKARRVAVHYSGCDELMEHANPNLLSLLCFEKPLPNCSRQRLLKVLSDMKQGVPREIPIDFECFHGLTHLRYCGLNGKPVGGSINSRSFESFISGLKFVETLNLHLGHGDVGEFQLPDNIWNVKTLRHVMLWPCQSGPTSSADLRTLQTLSGVKSRESWNEQLPKLPNVRHLGIEVERSFSWDLFAKFLGTLKHLTSISLDGHAMPPEIINIQRFPFYQHLQSLYLKEMSPSVENKLSLQVGMFSIHITVLALWNLQFNDDPLPVLEKLRSLRLLWLYGEKGNQKMSCSAGGFKQLHELRFSFLDNLEEWEIEAGAMPILKIVGLVGCIKLGVPLGLQYLSNLKQLEVSGSCMELQKHADEIRDICKHVPDISFY